MDSADTDGTDIIKAVEGLKHNFQYFMDQTSKCNDLIQKFEHLQSQHRDLNQSSSYIGEQLEEVKRQLNDLSNRDTRAKLEENSELSLLVKKLVSEATVSLSEKMAELTKENKSLKNEMELLKDRNYKEGISFHESSSVHNSQVDNASANVDDHAIEKRVKYLEQTTKNIQNRFSSLSDRIDSITPSVNERLKHINVCIEKNEASFNQVNAHIADLKKQLSTKLSSEVNSIKRTVLEKFGSIDTLMSEKAEVSLEEKLKQEFSTEQNIMSMKIEAIKTRLAEITGVPIGGPGVPRTPFAASGSGIDDSLATEFKIGTIEKTFPFRIVVADLQICKTEIASLMDKIESAQSQIDALNLDFKGFNETSMAQLKSLAADTVRNATSIESINSRNLQYKNDMDSLTNEIKFSITDIKTEQKNMSTRIDNAENRLEEKTKEIFQMKNDIIEENTDLYNRFLSKLDPKKKSKREKEKEADPIRVLETKAYQFEQKFGNIERELMQLHNTTLETIDTRVTKDISDLKGDLRYMIDEKSKLHTDNIARVQEEFENKHQIHSTQIETCMIAINKLEAATQTNFDVALIKNIEKKASDVQECNKTISQLEFKLSAIEQHVKEISSFAVTPQGNLVNDDIYGRVSNLLQNYERKVNEKFKAIDSSFVDTARGMTLQVNSKLGHDQIPADTSSGAQVQGRRTTQIGKTRGFDRVLKGTEGDPLQRMQAIRDLVPDEGVIQYFETLEDEINRIKDVIKQQQEIVNQISSGQIDAVPSASETVSRSYNTIRTMPSQCVTPGQRHISNSTSSRRRIDTSLSAAATLSSINYNDDIAIPTGDMVDTTMYRLENGKMSNMEKMQRDKLQQLEKRMMDKLKNLSERTELGISNINKLKEDLQGEILTISSSVKNHQFLIDLLNKNQQSAQVHEVLTKVDILTDDINQVKAISEERGRQINSLDARLRKVQDNVSEMATDVLTSKSVVDAVSTPGGIGSSISDYSEIAFIKEELRKNKKYINKVGLVIGEIKDKIYEANNILQTVQSITSRTNLNSEQIESLWSKLTQSYYSSAKIDELLRQQQQRLSHGSKSVEDIVDTIKRQNDAIDCIQDLEAKINRLDAKVQNELKLSKAQTARNLSSIDTKFTDQIDTLQNEFRGLFNLIKDSV